jgi:hypothetical protein
VSFGHYTNFKFEVYNECLSISSSNPPANYDIWQFSTDPNSFKPFVYQIWHGATPETYKLPRLAAKLSSDFSGKNYRTAAQECGPQITYEMTIT